ncbi:MAG: hypothetical protein JWO30_2897 [Fibrobacteres bacterium]|nr:hypothetical protein [Fibrobacterota bacterium]
MIDQKDGGNPMMGRKYFGLAFAILALCIPHRAAAQGKTFSGDNFAITFKAAGWDTATSSYIISKYGGLYGMATMGATASTTLPDLDSLTAAFADTLGGKITKDSAGVKTLGKYEVHWQKYTYDTLPKLSALVSKAAGFPVTLKNGSFRVYYLVADGYAFTIACMSVLAGGVAPYGDVEQAIATLKLGSLAGISNVARASRDLWIRNGQLGGGWLQANKLVAVEGFDAGGALIGAGTPASEGVWNLPVSKGDMFLRVRAANGTDLHFVVHP